MRSICLTTKGASAARTRAPSVSKDRAEEIIGDHFSKFYSEEDRAAGIPAQALTIAARFGRYSSEGWRIRKDGSRFWADVVIDPIRVPSGALIGY